MRFITDSNDLSVFLGQPLKKNLKIKGISIDTRTIKKEYLFIAIKGEVLDGNDYIFEAIKKGASLVITDRLEYKGHKNKKIIYVNNSLIALKKISKNILKTYKGNIIGITGSNGKTTTTKIVSNTLTKSSSTIKNFNNEIGMPLSIFHANKKSKNLVIEMGAAKSGDINYLSSILKPDIGIITNIGNSHLENLKNINGVLKVKSELIPNIKKGGYLIVPNDNLNYLQFWKQQCNYVHMITFGKNKNADFYPENIKSSIEKLEFNIISKKFDVNFKVKSSLSGDHNMKNIMAAFAVSFLLKESLEKFNKRLNKNSIVRQKQTKWLKKSLLIDDSYNANPDSVKKAIDLLSSSNKRKILILGDMLELGRFRKLLHKDVGKYAKLKKIDIFLGFGDLTKYAIQSFGKNGFFFKDEDDLRDFLKLNIKRSDVVLLKGSRGMRMERFINV